MTTDSRAIEVNGSGDGSFQSGIQGLWTAAGYQIPVLLVVFNNQNYQSKCIVLLSRQPPSR